MHLERTAVITIGQAPPVTVQELNQDGKLSVSVNGCRVPLSFETAIAIYSQKEYGE